MEFWCQETPRRVQWPQMDPLHPRTFWREDDYQNVDEILSKDASIPWPKTAMLVLMLVLLPPLLVSVLRPRDHQY
jgi:hypothetical protein